MKNIETIQADREKREADERFREKLQLTAPIRAKAECEIGNILDRKVKIVVYDETDNKKIILPHEGVSGLIMSLVCDVFGVDTKKLVSRSRKRVIVDARRALIMTLVNHLDMHPEDAMRIAHRDRSNYYHTKTMHEDLYDTNPLYCSMIDKIDERLDMKTYSQNGATVF